MKTQKCISILSVTLTGLLIGAPQALAMPLLDSDLGSFTALGASSESYSPKNGREGSGSHANSVQAIAAINASPANAGSGTPATGAQHGVGAEVRLLAQALHLAGMSNPGNQAQARRASNNEPAGEAGNQPRSPTREDQKNARKYLCAVAQANMPDAAFDPSLCKDDSTPDDFQTVGATPGSAANPSSDQSAPSTNRAVSDQESGELAKDMEHALLLAALPVNLGSDSDNAGNEPTGGPLQSTSPDIATAFAAVPAALVIDELVNLVPEPATLALLALGLTGIGFSRKRTA